MRNLFVGLSALALSIACGGGDGGNGNFTLTVQKSGTGGGTVSSTGISCGSDCSERVSSGAALTLTATADAGSQLAGWTGCDSSSGGTCQVTVNADRTVTATFTLLAAGTHLLTVQRAGTGTGAVSATGISCGSDCTEAYTEGTQVTLTATPDTGSSLASWSGCASSAGASCTVSMTADKTVTATFSLGAVTVVSNDITVATTWQTGGIYQVTGPIDVTAALTIQPGVLVRFDSGASLNVTGSINADGQSAATPIVFSSSAGSPSGGEWRGINLLANGSVFRNCAVYYAGASGQAALSLNSFSATVTNCTFAHHKPPTDGIAAAPALDASDAAAGTVIRDNLFYDDRVPLAVNSTFSVEANRFDNALAAPSNPQPSKYNAVVVRGCATVAANLTWATQAVPYVIGNPNDACNYLVVGAAGQLTIGAAGNNAVVKFFENGRISADGVLIGHAVFTSIREDRLGDTNGDGAASAPEAGDWNGITLSRNGSVFDGAAFRYAGGGDRSALAINSGHTATVTNCLFAHGRPAIDTIRAAPALDASDAAAGTVISGNTFFDNTVPLAMNTTLPIDDSNAFVGSDPQAATQGNKFQAIVVTGCGQVTSSITWSSLKVPLVIGNPTDACNYVTISASGHLTIADAVVVKFFGNGRLTADGVLTADATTGIVFTSFRDDAHGGDTNADGAASAPAGGDWEGIRAGMSGSVFSHVAFLYGGGAGTGQDASSLYVASGKGVTVTNSIFAHSRTTDATIRAPAALDVSDAAAGVTIQNNRFFDDTVPLAINVKQSLDDTNWFDSGVPAALQPNLFNAVVVAGCGGVAASTTWQVTKVPLVIGNPVDACNYITVSGGGHLTLGPNLVMKFFEDGRITVASSGELTVGAGDHLTCMVDDAHGGDTNADGSATTPVAGDWYGVKYFHSTGDPTCDESAYMHYQMLNNPDHSCTW